MRPIARRALARRSTRRGRTLLGAACALTAVACSPYTAAASTGATPPVAGNSEWPLDAAHFDTRRIWALSTGAGVTIAVVDTGVDASDPDLRGQVLPGVDLTDEAVNGQVDTSVDSHGTSVAGVIAADGNAGGGTRMTGLAPAAKILPVRIADSSSSVNPTLTAEGISYAATHGARIINLSLGTPIDQPEIRDAVNYAVNHDVIVVAAVGNSGQSGNEPMYPASIPGVLAVAGSTRNGAIWAQGESGSYVSLLAPAEDIYSTSDAGGYLSSAGTSYSAPYVSAAAALAWARYPTETAGQIIARLIESADPVGGTHGRNNQSGYGLVDPYRALTAPVPASTANPLLADSQTPVASPVGAKNNPLWLVLEITGGALAAAAFIGARLWTRRRRVSGAAAMDSDSTSRKITNTAKTRGAR